MGHRLTEDERHRILVLRYRGFPIEEIAKKYGVSKATIYNVIKKQRAKGL